MHSKQWLAAFLLVACTDPSKPAAPSDQPLSATASASSASSASAAAPTPARDRTAALNLQVTVEKDAWVVKARGVPGTGSCAAVTDAPKLKACARELKRIFPEETAVVVTCDPAIEYRRLVETLDVLRVDDKGELFPEFNFGLPKGVVAPPPPKASSSAAPPTARASVPLEARVLVSEPAEEGVVIRVSKTQITVGDEVDPIVIYGSEPLSEKGLPASVKANGQNDLYIVPLGRLLARYRQQDVKIRTAKGVDASSSDAIIIADETTPYRALFEVIYTAGQSEFGRYHLLVRTGVTR